MLLGQKYGVNRSVLLDLVQRADLTRPTSEADLVAAVRVLERIKANGLTTVTSDTAEPDGAPDTGRDAR